MAVKDERDDWRLPRTLCLFSCTLSSVLQIAATRLALLFVGMIIVLAGCVSEPLLNPDPEPTATRPPAVILDRNGDPVPTLGPDETPQGASVPTLASVCTRTGSISFLTNTAGLYGNDVTSAVAAFPASFDWWQCDSGDAENFGEVVIPTGEPQPRCFVSATETLRDAMDGNRGLRNMLDDGTVLCTNN